MPIPVTSQDFRPVSDGHCCRYNSGSDSWFWNHVPVKNSLLHFRILDESRFLTHSPVVEQEVLIAIALHNCNQPRACTSLYLYHL